LTVETHGWLEKEARVEEAAVCSGAEDEAAACFEVGDKATTCSKAGIKDGRWWRRHDNF
jgi:hypothetical protein